jgi:hypothetical protein
MEMGSERIDPVYEYVDRAIAEQKQALLITQRSLAILKMTSFRDFCSIHPSINSSLYIQIDSIAREMTLLVRTSDKPLSIADRFRSRSLKLLKASGVSIS